jgi:RNA polymerase sigma-70 factor (ECF subfamily)
VEQHGDSAHRTAFRLLRDREDASDAVQDALSLAFRRWAELRSEEAVRPWFFRILVNQCLSRLRRRAVRERALELLGHRAISSTPDHTVPADFSEHVLPHLLKLPLKQRTAIILRYGDERSVLEIAQAMGVSSDTVRTHIKRGLDRLRTRMESKKKGPGK